jgi:hypothetical protein
MLQGGTRGRTLKSNLAKDRGIILPRAWDWAKYIILSIAKSSSKGLACCGFFHSISGSDLRAEILKRQSDLNTIQANSLPSYLRPPVNTILIKSTVILLVTAIDIPRLNLAGLGELAEAPIQMPRKGPTIFFSAAYLETVNNSVQFPYGGLADNLVEPHRK